jgi:hypothetical protein
MYSILAATTVDFATAIETFFRSLITIGTTVAFLVASFFIVLAGFLWISANGDVRQIERAKSALTTALIGLGIILMANAIADLIFSALQVTPTT